MCGDQITELEICPLLNLRLCRPSPWVTVVSVMSLDHERVHCWLPRLVAIPRCRAQQAGENGKLSGKQYFLQMDSRTRDEVRTVQPCSIELFWQPRTAGQRLLRTQLS